MPRFLVPILALSLSSGMIFFILLNYTAPFERDLSSYQLLPTLYFLTALFFAVAFSFTLIFFFLINLVKKPWDKKSLARQSLRRGFLVGLWVAGFLLLRLSKTYHLLNLVLMTMVLVAVEIVLKDGLPRENP